MCSGAQNRSKYNPLTIFEKKQGKNQNKNEIGPKSWFRIFFCIWYCLLPIACCLLPVFLTSTNNYPTSLNKPWWRCAGGCREGNSNMFRARVTNKYANSGSRINFFFGILRYLYQNLWMVGFKWILRSWTHCTNAKFIDCLTLWWKTSF